MSLITDLFKKKPSTPDPDIPEDLRRVAFTLNKASKFKAYAKGIGAMLALAVLFGVLSYAPNKQSPAVAVKTGAGVSAKSTRQPVDTEVKLTPAPNEEIAKPKAETKGEAKRDARQGNKKDALELKPNKSLQRPELVVELPPNAKGGLKKIDVAPPPAGDAPRKPTAEDHMRAAKEFETQKGYAKAVESYKKALSEDFANVAAINGIAFGHINLGMADEAVKYGRMAYKVDPKYVPALINLGIALYMSKNIAESEKYFQKALAIEPRNRYALLNLGVLYEGQGAFEKALECFNRLTAQGNMNGYIGIARIAEKRGNMEEAIDAYKKLVALESVDNETKQFATEKLMLLEH